MIESGKANMHLLRPATDSFARRLQAVGGALLAGLIFGYPAYWTHVFGPRWFYPIFVLAVSPIFIWRLSGWTQGFGFASLQIFCLLVLLRFLGVDTFYLGRDSVFGSLKWPWKMAAALGIVVLIMSVFRSHVSRPERKELSRVADLILPAIWLPVLGIWLFSYFSLHLPPFGNNYIDHLIKFPGWFWKFATLVSAALFFLPICDRKIISKVSPEKPGELLIGLGVEMALVFALYGWFRTLSELTEFTSDWEQAGKTVLSIIKFFHNYGFFFILMMVVSYCAMPLKAPKTRKGLLGAIAAAVVFFTAIHYPVFYRPEEFPEPPPELVTKTMTWRVSIPLAAGKKVLNGPIKDCNQVTVYRYLNPVTLETNCYCLRDGETAGNIIKQMLNDPLSKMHPIAKYSYGNALEEASLEDYIRYRRSKKSTMTIDILTSFPPNPIDVKLVEQEFSQELSNDEIRNFPPIACNYARAFHHFGDEPRAELYLALCGDRYQSTFNQMYLSQSKIRGKIAETPWPSGRYRMKIEICNRNYMYKYSPVRPDGSFEFSEVTAGKLEARIIVYGNVTRDLHIKPGRLLTTGWRETINVNGQDPVDLGEITIRVGPEWVPE